MEINPAGLALVKYFEGCFLTPYKCPAGVCTIGIGHTHNVTMQTPKITEEEALELLKDDLYQVEQEVWHLVKAPMTSNQFSALVCLVFNIGSGNFSKSHILSSLNDGKYADAAAHILDWHYIKKKPSNGLIKRRQAEADLFLKPDFVGGKDYAISI